MKGRRVAAAVLAMLFLLAQRAWAVDISATAAVLMDADTGRILYEKNPDRRMLVASTTKILTALVVLESCELRSTVKVTQEHMAEGSSMYLKLGEEVTVECLLYGLLLASGNDAALALAEACGGVGIRPVHSVPDTVLVMSSYTQPLRGPCFFLSINKTLLCTLVLC